MGNYIISDDINGGYLATRYLLDMGYKKVFHFAGPDHISAFLERKKEYCKAMKEKNLYSEKLIKPCDIKIYAEMDIFFPMF